MMGASTRSRGAAFAVTATLLAVFCALQLLSLWRAPAVFSPATITVTLQAGDALQLGHDALAAPQADPVHLALRRDAAGRWLVRNASAGKQLLLQRLGDDQATGAASLRDGQQVQIGAARFDVLASSASAVSFTHAGAQWRYDGAVLLRDGRPQSACPDARAGSRAAALWNHWLPAALNLARPLTFGGNLNCGNRVGVANVAPASAVLARVRQELVLSPGAADGQRTPLLLVDGDTAVDLAHREETLEGVTALVAGRTRLALHIDGERLELRPLRHVALALQPHVALPPQVAWQLQQRSPWSLPAGGAWTVALSLFILLAGAAALSWQGGRWPFQRAVPAAEQTGAMAAALLAIGGLTAMLLQRAGTPPGVGVSLLLACAALWCWLLAPGRLTLATGAGTLLIAVGLLSQLELGLGAMESSWLRHYQKTSALLALGAGAGTLLRLRLRRSAGGMIAQTRLECLLATLAGAALLALLLQVAVGDETGVFDLQPVEFAKLALTALTAHCMAVGLGWQSDVPGQTHPALRWLRLAAPALLFLALLGLALVQVDDYSPLILLMVWSASMAFAWSLATRRHAISATLALTALGAAGMVAWLRSSGAGDTANVGFYAERFLVWLDPASHPHTGQQLLLAASAISDGAWWGRDHWLGLGALGQPAGSVLAIPAVQDDFAAAFFLNRHGLLAALGLWLLQALFLAGLVATGLRAFAASQQARHFRQAWQGRFRCFALVGGAAFVLGHLMLSWGTNLAIFPVMGQPMSFLSAGGSHLLFFICPLLAFSAISAQSLEETSSCRSMSNTR